MDSCECDEVLFSVLCVSSVSQSLLLSVWLQREREVLHHPEQRVRNLHALLVILSNMKGVCLLALSASLTQMSDIKERPCPSFDQVQ